ncbi:myc box-dependent-interacting protein 1 isoform X2 [Nematostella vectensis]|uniref:myc box-dependent-interacting protein 1 isoform X2 n=1 Tax=Nematostella vectensis TaxID=45351 RepID=UPI002077742E|nr:myc box-dependent-interacting protein 1 isoform X2 [Nematostella vectensis]
MAEKGEKSLEKGFLARTASITSKRAKRAQEKVKQKLGKANETKDVTFDEFVSNFNKQQAAAQKLQKEFKNYNNCVKAMLSASADFSEAMKDVYEPDWSGRDVVFKLLDQLHVYYADLQEKLQDEVLGPLTAYQSQFPDIKARINKHGRKLVDYDRYRHNYEAMRAKGKGVDQKKLNQCQEEFSEAKSVYTKLHAELYEELPALYDSRIAFYVSSFQSIFTAEAIFHREAGKIKTQMNDLMDGLVDELSSGTHTSRRPFQLSSISPISDSDESEHLSNPGEVAEPLNTESAVCNDEEPRDENIEAPAFQGVEEDEGPADGASPVHPNLPTNEGSEDDLSEDEQKPANNLPPSRPPAPIDKPTPTPRPPILNAATEDPATNAEIPGVLYKGFWNFPLVLFPSNPQISV